MPQKIITGYQLDAQLLEKGYVVVPFLQQEEVERLKNFFYQNHPKGVEGFYATAHSPDIDFRQRMNDEIKKVFAEAIQKYFHDCTALGGSFVVKSKTNTTRLQPHQDWNIVNEEKFRSFNIWVPLVDLTEKNGVIRVLPKSHLWVKNFRGPNISDNFQNVLDEIWIEMEPLFMKAGEALIYDHRLFHASDPNTTDELRLAAVFGIIPTGAPMFYYFGNNGKIEVYESSVDFFLKENIQNGRKVLKKIKEIETDKNLVTQPQLQQFLGKRVRWSLKKLFSFIR